MRILVVEDENKTAAYLRKGLAENGFAVDVSRQGEEGLRLARTGAYDLLVLDVMLPERDGFAVLAELRRLGDGVEQEEVDRVKAGLKSALIMQEESTGSRAATLASDWYFLGRVRSFDEMQATINALTPEGIVDYARRFPPRDLTIVTLGPKPLRVG